MLSISHTHFIYVYTFYDWRVAVALLRIYACYVCKYGLNNPWCIIYIDMDGQFRDLKKNYKPNFHKSLGKKVYTYVLGGVVVKYGSLIRLASFPQNSGISLFYRCALVCIVIEQNYPVKINDDIFFFVLCVN